MVEFLLDVGSRCLSDELLCLMASVEERLRTPDQRGYWRSWPGEHYRLIAAIARHLRAKKAVEIGTSTGMGTLAFLAGGVSEVTTFDIVPWYRFPFTVLEAADIATNVRQLISNLAKPDVFRKYLAIIANADVVLIDGPKDGIFEPALFKMMADHRVDLRRPLFIVDDTRILPLSRTWLEMESQLGPMKLDSIDATSLGHWSGTALGRFL